jgi:hypothetical protein
MHRAVFFDDQLFNFEDQDLCRTVFNVKSRLGQKVTNQSAVWKKLPANLFQWAYEDDDEDSILYKNAGLSINVLYQWHQKLIDNSDMIAFFDWDRTITSWDGLCGEDTGKWIQKCRREKAWESVREFMFGNKARLDILVTLLSMLSQQDRVYIVTNQENSRGIKAVLKALAKDYEQPSLNHIPVMAWEERGNITKFQFFKEILRDKCNIRTK